MTEAKKRSYQKRSEVLIRNLRSRHFEAMYCDTAEEAQEMALQMIPVGATVGWGGATTAEQIGLLNAIRTGEYRAIDRDTAGSAQERIALMHKCLGAEYFITGANALSVTGEMVNIDGMGNRVGAIVYGPEKIIVVAGMNKVADSLEDAVKRARTVAAPMNQQRFLGNTPCSVTGVCADCKSDDCICSQMLITRNCRPTGRITIILIGEDLGF